MALASAPISQKLPISAAAAPRRSGKIIVAGGGNICSNAVPLLARLPGVAEMIIADPQTFAAENLATQNIDPADLGHSKAIVLATRAIQIRGQDGFKATAFIDRIEHLPWGLLRDADLICAGVDSKFSRVEVQYLAWRLGIPWIDAGVQGAGMLARVNVYLPGPDSPCLECSFGPSDRELLSHSYACDGTLKEIAPTNSPAPLGALAAAMMALEAQKFLAGEFESTLIGRQWVLEARHHQHYVNTFRRNPDCGFDHEIWSIERLDVPLRTLGDLAEHGRRCLGSEDSLAVRVERNPWVMLVACPRCGRQAPTLCLQRRVAAVAPMRCESCGGEDNPVNRMQPMGFFLQPQLPLASSRPELLACPLASVGLRRGDVVTLISRRGHRHVELANLIDDNHPEGT
jgi:molybdopterin/thiamine biosynthesis adenylyltransferase